MRDTSFFYEPRVTCLLNMRSEMEDARLIAFKRLLDIMDELRTKCPWDSIQTKDSLRHLTIEEVFELNDAILADDWANMKKELGDILLHIVFYAKIGEEKGAFDITDVANAICDKLIVRHPHIFGEEKVETAAQVLDNWEKIKLDREGNKSVLGGVPMAMPSILKAYRMQEKAAGVGFEWPSTEDAWNKVEEEVAELKETLDNKESKQRQEEEMGDLLFALINYSRHLEINPDEALEHTNKKFKQRFEYIEKRASEQGRKVHNLSIGEMLALWREAK